ncbi:polyadenylate-binding protein 8 [Capsella rubella]|uniref:polyadenylate-binding protein 8 n=1 Tax=Capsella rubella TaxID=81985 RepID=UPI000CD4B837|nr:polyadenylate-binding protein 8 [Capsella rubella]
MEYFGWDYMFERWKDLWLTSLYVENLEENMSDEDLYDLFSETAYVVRTHICRDPSTYVSCGYGYVFFANNNDAEKALLKLNFVTFKGRSIRVMYYGQYLSLNGVGNIFIKNLDKSIDHKALHNIFSGYGLIVRSKVASDASGQSKGFGFVQYNTEESAHKAIEHMNGMVHNDTKVSVRPFSQRDCQSVKEIFVNVVVKKIPKCMTETELNTIFQKFGPTTSCVIKINDQGKSKRFGYVNFVNPKDAARSVKALNGKKFGYYKKWYVAKSKEKYDMALVIKRRLKSIAERSHGSNNLCVKKLDITINDEILKDFFSPYGTILLCKVMRDSSGVSKGSGFVTFSKPEEASKAIEAINREMNITKQVYVDLAIALTYASPEHQRTMLRENLYHRVEQLEPHSAAKITGMILEMDHDEVHHLLESHDSLKSKAKEAMDVLRTEQQLR